MIQKLFLNKSECEQVIGMSGELRDSLLTNTNSSKPFYNDKRICKESKLPQELLNSLFSSRLHQFGINGFGDTRILNYTKGSKFAPHVDSQKGGKEQRKKTLIIQLSESSDYTGGNLVVEGKYADRTQGTVIIFDSTNIHELQELTDGERWCLVSWIEDKHLINSLV